MGRDGDELNDFYNPAHFSTQKNEPLKTVMVTLLNFLEKNSSAKA